MLTRTFTHNGRLHLITFGPLALCSVDIVIMCISSYFIDLTFMLHSDYINIWPMNVRYIAALRSFGISENTIAYIAISTAHSTIIDGLYCIFVFLTFGIIHKFTRSYPFYRYKASWTQIGGYLLFWLLIVGYILITDFENSHSLRELSVHRPMILSLILLHFIIYLALISSTLTLCLLINKLTETFIRGRES